MHKAFLSSSRVCCRSFSWHKTSQVLFSNASISSAETSSNIDYSTKKHRGLDFDETWEAEILRHERDIDRLRKKGVEESDLPELQSEEKLKNLPHLSFRGKSQFDKDLSLIDETSDVLLGTIEQSQNIEEDLASVTNIDPVFARNDVQILLKRIHNRCSLEHVYKPTITERKEMPALRYLTDDQLKQEMERIKETVDEKIKMPLVMTERKSCKRILSNDSVLDGYEDCNVSFVDISENLENRERFIVVRQTDGVLRYADWSERDRSLNLYYPTPGRQTIIPSLFEKDNMKNIFKHKNHENALDQCVTQCEPDAKEYIDFFQAVYTDIDQQKLYDLLRSTRYFGGLVYYLAKNFTIDGIVLDMIQRNLIEDAADCVRLLTLLHPDCKTKSLIILESSKDIVIIEAYISNDSKDPTALNLALENYKNSVNETSNYDDIQQAN